MRNCDKKEVNCQNLFRMAIWVTHSNLTHKLFYYSDLLNDEVHADNNH